MRPASSAALAFLLSRATGFFADLFTITLMDTTVFYWTSFDINITYGGITWLAQSPNLARSSLNVRNSPEQVPELKVVMSALDNDFVDGTNIKTQIFQGAFDGARLQLDRLPMTFPGDTSLGPPITLFGGRIGQIQITSIGADISVKGDNIIFNQYVPKNVFQTNCLNTFCDPNCTLSKADFSITTTVGPGPTVGIIPWSSTPSPSQIYTLGVVTFISGVNIGQSRSIAVSDDGGLTLRYPLFAVPAAGDAITVLQGCDKQINGGNGQSCQDRSNTQHYRGFPFVPPPEYSP